jgi:hypothetical protein
MGDKAVRSPLPWMALLALAVSVLIASSAEGAKSCAGCHPDGEPCTLEYGAAGIVRDRATGDPIAGAAVTVLDLSTVSGSDGSYEISGTRPETCHLDYYYTLSASADGYEPYRLEIYATHTFPHSFEILLEPAIPAGEFSITGSVAEFPPCSGRMRGVTVTLEPLGWTTQTSLGPDGGLFEFDPVPPGDYTLTVTPGCNPFGCWRDTPVPVTGEHARVEICMDAPTPAVPPTPTRTPTPTPDPCPVRPTPCPIGEQPRPCDDPCGLHCGCDACPPCEDGEVEAHQWNLCRCTDAGELTTPTPANTQCVGDCNGDGTVGVDELVLMVSVAVGRTAGAACFAGHAAGETAVHVTDILAAVDRALHGCPGGSPSPTPEPLEWGTCYESADCFPCDVYPCRPFVATRDFCCSLARNPGGTFSWCPADRFDPSSGECTGCEHPC